MKIAFVRVPKTASSAIVQEDVPEICPGLLNLNYNGECYIKHRFAFHHIKGRYCIFDKPSQHVAVSVYNNLENHNHFFYTQIRDPYDMACSLYFFLKRVSEQNNFIASIKGSNVDADNHNAQIVAKGASVNEFLENMMHNQTYTHYYDDLDIKNFDCLGKSDDIEKTQELFEKIFNIKINTYITNANPNKKINEPYNFEFTREDFKKLNENEYEIFYDGIKKFDQLCNKYL